MGDSEDLTIMTEGQSAGLFSLFKSHSILPSSNVFLLNFHTHFKFSRFVSKFEVPLLEVIKPLQTNLCSSKLHI